MEPAPLGRAPSAETLSRSTVPASLSGQCGRKTTRLGRSGGGQPTSISTVLGNTVWAVPAPAGMNRRLERMPLAGPLVPLLAGAALHQYDLGQQQLGAGYTTGVAIHPLQLALKEMPRCAAVAVAVHLHRPAQDLRLPCLDDGEAAI
jgi:hypothetical protein